MRSYAVTSHYGGWRLDRFLQAMVPKLSREKIRKAIESRVETSWHLKPRPALRVVSGGVVTVHFPPVVDVEEVSARPVILHEDEAILIVEKPAGLLVHPTHACRTANVVHLLREERPGDRIALAHRLDRETSGLLLIARTVEASRSLSDQFASGGIRKTYRALVHGLPAVDRGMIDRPLGVSRSLDVVFRRASDGVKAQSARTNYLVVRRFQRHSLLDVYPMTGRRHQIRAHLAEAGHPIVGDKLYATDARFFLKLMRYGKTALDAEARECLEAGRQLLHAGEISFDHPSTGERVTFRSPLPEDFALFLASLAHAPDKPRTPGARSMPGEGRIPGAPRAPQRRARV